MKLKLMYKIIIEDSMIEMIPIELKFDFDHITNEFIKQNVKGTLDYYTSIEFVKPWISYLAKDKDNNYVGICGFKGRPKNNIIEIAYGTNPEYENRGFADKMCKKLIEIVKNENKEIKITARTLPEINASTKVLTKNRFINNGKITDPDDGEVFEWILKE